MENMNNWNKMARPPIAALKKITGGRLSGMSNIAPQWRWQIMTEVFGMVGFGWKYTTEKKWTSPGANEEHFCFVEILLYVKVDDKWSDAIPGSGGSMLVSKEKNGMHNNDEAFKMAETDALGTAMAKLGVAADIYLGTFDGSKYNTPQTFPNQISTPKEAIKASPAKNVVPPPPTAVGVDKDFPMTNEAQEIADGYTASQLRISEHIKTIKEFTKNSTPEILVVINAIPKGEKRTIGQIVKELSYLQRVEENKQTATGEK